MNTPPQDRLRHMLEAIDAIDDLSGLNRALTRVERAAFERFFEIVSEASRHIPEELRTSHPLIPWRGIADLGNGSGTAMRPSISKDWSKSQETI